MSVTRLGVSLLKVVATIERPASHHGTARPETKNSDVLRPARLPRNSAGTKQINSDAATMIQSSGCSCIGSRCGAEHYNPSTTVTGLNWYWISLMATVPPIAALLVALLFW